MAEGWKRKGLFSKNFHCYDRVFNNRHTIAEAIDSVLVQTYPDIEYVVVDGGSCDGTVGIVESYRNRLEAFISEPDRGIYDGLNKGMALASGDVCQRQSVITLNRTI